MTSWYPISIILTKFLTSTYSNDFQKTTVRPKWLKLIAWASVKRCINKFLDFYWRSQKLFRASSYKKRERLNEASKEPYFERRIVTVFPLFFSNNLKNLGDFRYKIGRWLSGFGRIFSRTVFHFLLCFRRCLSDHILKLRERFRKEKQDFVHQFLSKLTVSKGNFGRRSSKK